MSTFLPCNLAVLRQHALLQRTLDGDIEVAISQPIIDETLGVLRKKFNWQQANLDAALAVIQSCTRLVNARRSLDVAASDPDDNSIIECADSAGSAAIVTGDKDFLRRGEYEGIGIISVRDFASAAHSIVSARAVNCPRRLESYILTMDEKVMCNLTDLEKRGPSVRYGDDS